MFYIDSHYSTTWKSLMEISVNYSASLLVSVCSVYAFFPRKRAIHSYPVMLKLESISLGIALKLQTFPLVCLYVALVLFNLCKQALSCCLFQV